MHLAVSKNMVKTMQLFLNCEDPVPELEMKNSNGFTILHIAACNGYVNMVKLLMETGKSRINIWNFEQLFYIANLRF